MIRSLHKSATETFAHEHSLHNQGDPATHSSFRLCSMSVHVCERMLLVCCTGTRTCALTCSDRHFYACVAFCSRIKGPTTHPGTKLELGLGAAVHALFCRRLTCGLRLVSLQIRALRMCVFLCFRRRSTRKRHFLFAGARFVYTWKNNVATARSAFSGQLAVCRLMVTFFCAAVSCLVLHQIVNE